MHYCAQTKIMSMVTSLTTYPLTLIIRELVNSQSKLEIRTSLSNNMLLQRTSNSDVHQKRNLNISLSLTSRMRENGIPARHPKLFLLSIQHQYSTQRELYLMTNLFMTGYSFHLTKKNSALSVLKPKGKFTPECFSRIWHCSLETSKQTPAETTCKHYRQMFRVVAHIFIPFHNFIQYRQLTLTTREFYSNTMSSKITPVCGYTCAQIYGKKFW